MYLNLVIKWKEFVECKLIFYKQHFWLILILYYILQPDRLLQRLWQGIELQLIHYYLHTLSLNMIKRCDQTLKLSFTFIFILCLHAIRIKKKSTFHFLIYLFLQYVLLNLIKFLIKNIFIMKLITIFFWKIWIVFK